MIFFGFATGHGNLNDAKCANFTLSVDIYTTAKLVDMIFKKNVEYIEVSVYIEKKLLDTFLQNDNVIVDPTVALPPYYKFVWVNEAGMKIHKMDYRFKMLSLGTLGPSVKTINLNLETNKTDCFRNMNVTEIFEKIHNTFRKALYYSGSSNAIDYSYLCHRYERYTDYEDCLASKCFMFNENHQSQKDGFCSNNVNKLVNAQHWICFFLFILFINNLPLLVFWLYKDQEEDKTDKKEGPDRAAFRCAPGRIENAIRWALGRIENAVQGALTSIESAIQRTAGRNGNEDPERQAGETRLKQGSGPQQAQSQGGGSQPAQSQAGGSQPAQSQAGGSQPEQSQGGEPHQAQSQGGGQRQAQQDTGAEQRVRHFYKLAYSFVFTFAFTLFYIWWFLIANFAHKPIEFRQRSKMSKGIDDYLIYFELGLAGVWNIGSILFLFSLIYSFACNMILVHEIGWKSWWTRNDKFFLLDIECQDQTLQFNCLHRQSLLFSWSFWKAFWLSLLPKCCCKPKCDCDCDCSPSDICSIVVAHIWIIPSALIAIVFLMCPLLDIVLHVFSDHDDEENPNTPISTSDTLIFKKRRFSFNPIYTLAVIICELLALLCYISCFFAYMYPTATVCSMIVSYTITGLMKNWDLLLPVLILGGTVFSHSVKLVYGALQPRHDLHMEIYNTYQKMSPDFKKLREKVEQLNDLIKEKTFPDVNGLLIGFPKLNSFIEQKNYKQYIRRPAIFDLYLIFPSLKGFLTFENSDFFLCVQEIINILNMFGKLILEKDGRYYVKCEEKEELNKKIIKYMYFIDQSFIIKQDGSYYIKLPCLPKKLKLNFETSNHLYEEGENFCFPDIDKLNRTLPEIQNFIVEHNEKYYIKVDNVKINDVQKTELEKNGMLLIKNTGCCYIQCPQILLDSWYQVPLNDLVERKKNGDYIINDSSLKKKCDLFLIHSQSRFYAFYALVELIGLCLFVAVIGIGTIILDDDRNVGKVVLGIFLTYIPKLFDMFTKPGTKDVLKSKKDDFVNEIMKDELKKRQNALALTYILIALQFFCD